MIFLKVRDFEDPNEIPKQKYLVNPVITIALDDLIATGGSLVQSK